ncbi:Dyp-type peroxidase [Leifsonia sp. NPDC058248]|uniref:Dyp-type peroxidase n=1 Tax=Leifsonia sp. NPDC058248 TaxID=3346402 RepID=UPI0036DDC944
MGTALERQSSTARGDTDTAELTRHIQSPYGPTQRGVSVPETPQTHTLLSSFDLPDPRALRTTTTELAASLADIGSAIAQLANTKPGDDPLIPDGPEGLTATIGIGPRVARLVDAAGVGTTNLPAFAGDEHISPTNRDGDILIAVSSDSPSTLLPATDFLISRMPGATFRWRQAGVRGHSNGSIVRNPLGFHDGVIVPRGGAQLAENVWISDGRYAEGSIMVIRRLRLDIARWNSLTTSHQESIIGRQKMSGVPLSGGKATDAADLHAKTPDGEYLTPVRSHVRAAHPSFTGSRLMLRRSYMFDSGMQGSVPNAGLLFIAYQNDLNTFIDTQLRLDAQDDLMGFASPSASATFLVLPGFTHTRPLGHCLTN